MKDGKLACEGTPLELKHRYDCGYELLVQQDLPSGGASSARGETSSPMHGQQAALLRPASATSTKAAAASASARASGGGGVEDDAGACRAALERFVLEGVPGAHRHRLHPVPSEMRFTLPLAARAGFGAFLAALEARSGELKVGNYGIAMAPFEEVFLRVGAESAVTRSQKRRPSLASAPSALERGTGGSASASGSLKGGDKVEEAGGETAEAEASDTFLPHADESIYSSAGASATYSSSFWRQVRMCDRQLEIE
jgi:hypothetical protein